MSTTHFDNPVSTPISAIPAAELTQEGSASCLAALHLKHGDAPVMLRRTDEGRALSRARYRDAASSLITFGLQARTTEGMLYRAGIIAQAGLSAHLLDVGRSAEHTSELQSLMRISYAGFCLKNNKRPHNT